MIFVKWMTIKAPEGKDERDSLYLLLSRRIRLRTTQLLQVFLVDVEVESFSREAIFMIHLPLLVRLKE
jgi:hypothetical protein